jgi:hypothetical protein
MLQQLLLWLRPMVLMLQPPISSLGLSRWGPSKPLRSAEAFIERDPSRCAPSTLRSDRPDPGPADARLMLALIAPLMSSSEPLAQRDCESAENEFEMEATESTDATLFPARPTLCTLALS